MKNKISNIILMVIASLLILSIAAYAWVEVVEGINIRNIIVKPGGDSNIQIKAQDGTFALSVDAKTKSAQGLNPVSTVDLKNWYIPNSVDSSGKATSFKKINSDEEGLYFYSEQFWINYTATASTTVKLSSIVVDYDSDDQTAKALRVGFLVENDVYIYAPVEGFDDNCESVIDGGYKKIVYNTYTSKNLNFILSKGGECGVQVFVWYEGQDSNYTQANLANAGQVKITINFVEA